MSNSTSRIEKLNGATIGLDELLRANMGDFNGFKLDTLPHLPVVLFGYACYPNAAGFWNLNEIASILMADESIDLGRADANPKQWRQLEVRERLETGGHLVSVKGNYSDEKSEAQKLRFTPTGQGTWADELAMTMYAQWVSLDFAFMVAAAFLETRRRALELLTEAAPKVTTRDKRASKSGLTFNEVCKEASREPRHVKAVMIKLGHMRFNKGAWEINPKFLGSGNPFREVKRTERTVVTALEKDEQPNLFRANPEAVEWLTVGDFAETLNERLPALEEIDKSYIVSERDDGYVTSILTSIDGRGVRTHVKTLADVPSDAPQIRQSGEVTHRLAYTYRLFTTRRPK